MEIRRKASTSVRTPFLNNYAFIFLVLHNTLYIIRQYIAYSLCLKTYAVSPEVAGSREASTSIRTFFNNYAFIFLVLHTKKLYITLKYIAYSLRLNTYAVSPEVESNVLKLSGENLYYNRCTIN